MTNKIVRLEAGAKLKFGVHMKQKNFYKDLFRASLVKQENKKVFFIFTSFFLVLQFSFLFHLVTLYRYLAIDIGAWWLFSPPTDGWCDTSVGQGIGAHCFGDYSLTARIASESNPWSNSLTGSFNYPAGGLIIFRALFTLEELLGIQNFGLFVFLILTIISLALPSILLGAKTPFVLKTLLAVGSITSLPGLLIIDRGNSVGIAFAFLTLFVFFYSQKKDSKAIVFLVLASLIKPQFAIFFLIFFFRRQWKYALLSLTSIATSQIAAFALWPSAFPDSLRQSISAVVGYSSNWDFSNPTLPNYSIGRGLNLLLTMFQVEAQNYIQIIVIVVLSLLSVVLFAYSQRMTTLTLLVYLGTVAAFGINISWGYYAVIPIIYLFTLLRSDASCSRQSSSLASTIVAIGSALTLARVIFLLPTSEGWIAIENTPTIGLMWLAISVILMFLDIKEDHKMRKSKDECPKN